MFRVLGVMGFGNSYLVYRVVYIILIMIQVPILVVPTTAQCPISKGGESIENGSFLQGIISTFCNIESPGTIVMVLVGFGIIGICDITEIIFRAEQRHIGIARDNGIMLEVDLVALVVVDEDEGIEGCA